MRLWPFGHSSEEDQPTAVEDSSVEQEGDAGPLDAPGPEAPAPPEPAAVRRFDDPGWPSLEPLRPTLGPMPRIASAHFDEDLGSWRNPTVSLLPLAHRRAAGEPAGEVSGIAQVHPIVPPTGPRAEEGGPPLTLPQPTAGAESRTQVLQRELLTPPPSLAPSPRMVSTPSAPETPGPENGLVLVSSPRRDQPEPQLLFEPASPTGLLVVMPEAVAAAPEPAPPPPSTPPSSPLTPDPGPTVDDGGLPLAARPESRTEEAAVQRLDLAPPQPQGPVGAVAAPVVVESAAPSAPQTSGATTGASEAEANEPEAPLLGDDVLEPAAASAAETPEAGADRASDAQNESLALASRPATAGAPPEEPGFGPPALSQPGPPVIFTPPLAEPPQPRMIEAPAPELGTRELSAGWLLPPPPPPAADASVQRAAVGPAAPPGSAGEGAESAALLGERPIETPPPGESGAPAPEVGAGVQPLDLASPSPAGRSRLGLGAPLDRLPDTARPILDPLGAASLPREVQRLVAPSLDPPRAEGAPPTGTSPGRPQQPAVPIEALAEETSGHEGLGQSANAPVLGLRPVEVQLAGDVDTDEPLEVEPPVLQLPFPRTASTTDRWTAETRDAPAQWPWRTPSEPTPPPQRSAQRQQPRAPGASPTQPAGRVPIDFSTPGPLAPFPAVVGEAPSVQRQTTLTALPPLADGPPGEGGAFRVPLHVAAFDFEEAEPGVAVSPGRAEIAVQSLPLPSRPTAPEAPRPVGLAFTAEPPRPPAEPPAVQRLFGGLGSNVLGGIFGGTRSQQAEPEDEEFADVASEPASGGTEASGEMSNTDVRVLATRLYPYISHKLKAELGRDRERAGMITGLHR